MMVYVDFNPSKNTYYQSIKSIFMLIKSFLFTYKINLNFSKKVSEGFVCF